MKSRNLKTIHNLIVSNYQKKLLANGRFLHTFTPLTTDTLYSFEANGTDELEEGRNYNIGYYEDNNNNKIIDLSATSLADEINPLFSYHHAQYISHENSRSNKEKNDLRVKHQEKEGYYWGKKYAWRQFGLAIPKEAFYDYLKQIEHPSVVCETINPDLTFQHNEKSIAYKEDGIDDAIKELLLTAVKISKVYFKSPLYDKKFSIRSPLSMTDKK